MPVELTKAFAFSASRSEGERVLGRNYVLKLTLEAVPESAEGELERIVEASLISKIHSRDLGEVHFLSGIPKDDAGLLRVFADILRAGLGAYRLRRLSLERDSRTTTTLDLVNG